MTDGIDPTAAPTGTGCVECTEHHGWWVHLRRCAQCGHVGCCDSSPGQHARAHHRETGHPVMTSFEPGEDWFFDFRTGKGVLPEQLAPPTARPEDQPVPGPAGRVPDDWRSQLHGG